MASQHLSARSRARGFTLIELMVGLALGLLTTLVIGSVLVLADGKKRTLSEGADAQANGALALYALQREIQMAGYGTSINPAALGCPIKGSYKDPSAPADTPAIPFTPVLAPVTIVNGANGAPDTITILQSRKPGFSTPIAIASDHAKTDNFFVVKSSLGVAVDDLMIAVPESGLWDASHWCTLFSVTSDNAASPTDTTLSNTRIPHASGGTNKWNRSSVFPDDGYARNGYLLNLGSMALNTYSINAGNDMVITANTAGGVNSTAEAVFSQIVNLQAMYGKDTTGTGTVDTYDTTTPTTAADWQRVLAIRIAVVARSNQKELEAVTASAPQWDVGAGSTISGTSACHGDSKCLPLKVSHLTDWQRYRYRVYDTVVPLRNVLWNSAKTP